MPASRSLFSRMPAARSAAVALLALALCAAPLAAYKIWLKDGTSIEARDKYVVKNGRAIITLINGEQSFIDAAKIDVARTQAANRGEDYRDTYLSNTRVVPGEEPPVPVNKSLTDLIATHRPSNRQLPVARRSGEVAPGQVARTKAGFLDLSSLQRVPYGRTDVATDLQQFLRSQGIEEVAIWSGSQPDRLLLEISTSSEAGVFLALNAGANALLRVRERFPQTAAAFEVLLKTPTRERAGQFVLTPDIATALVAKKIDPPAFFVANVQF